MASTYLQRTPSVVGNRKTFTLSTWIKRADISNSQYILYGGSGSGNESGLLLASSGSISYFEFSGGYTVQIVSSNLYRDVGAFYHIVLKVDTTQATASDRVKIYVNGSEITYGTATYPSQNFDSYHFNNTSLHTVGASGSPALYFNGLMSHFHWIDGTAYDASTFGEYDAQNVWKPKTQPSVTYGTNGFFLKFANAGSLGTDSSGNGNNLTVNGTGTQTLDTPSNVFCTMSPIDKSGLSAGNSTLTNGNTRQDTVSVSQNSGSRSTLAVNSGKWYVEAKAFGSASPEFRRIGILGMDSSTWMTETNASLSAHPEGYAYKSDGNKGNNNSEVSYGNSYTNGDIVGIAFDADNGTIWFSKNGTWQNSATIAEIENGTTTNSAYSSIPMTRFYGFACTLAGATSNMGFEWNFGNGYYGTTAVSTPNADGDGYGKFEYSVPTGYYALCTKNIQTYG